jgi:hypothetical protein
MSQILCRKCRGSGLGCKIIFMLEPDPKKECGRNLRKSMRPRDRQALKLLYYFVYVLSLSKFLTYRWRHYGLKKSCIEKMYQENESPFEVSSYLASDALPQEGFRIGRVLSRTSFDGMADSSLRMENNSKVNINPLRRRSCSFWQDDGLSTRVGNKKPIQKNPPKNP